MRILFVVHGFPPEAGGGTETYASDLARALWRRGHEVTVIAREAVADQPEYRVRRGHTDGIAVVRINHTFRDASSFEHAYRNARIDAIVAALLDEERPDVVHVHHFTCLSTGIAAECAARGIPYVLTLNDYWMLCHRGQLLDLDLARCDGPEPGRCAACAGLAASAQPAVHLAARALRAVERHAPRPLADAQRRLASAMSASVVPASAAAETARRLEHMRHVWNGAARILAPSQTLRDQFARHGVPASRVTLQAQGIGARLTARQARVPGASLHIGFLGSLMVSKAPHLLLEATEGLPPGVVSLKIAGDIVPYHGDDSYADIVRPLLKGPDVEWLGRVPHEDVPGILAALDVLAVPSIWLENSPFVIKEAFAAGVPVIASNLGGMAELVEDGSNGLLFAAGDAADLRRVILRLLDEPDLLSALRSGIPHVKTIDEDAASTQVIYEDVLRQAPPRPLHRARPNIAAVVLNYDTPTDTLLAIHSLLASRRALDQLWVVDNGPDEACAQALAPVMNAIRYIRSSGNVGFSAGCNAGIKAALDAGAEMVLLVNSDAVVAPDALERLEHALVGSPNSGIAAPLIVSRAEPGIVASAGICYSTASGRMRHAGFGGGIDDACEGPSREMDAVSGCVMLIRRSLVEGIGAFDERYFYSFEDIEYCLRARRAGFASLLVPSAIAYHEGHQSIGAASPARLYYAARNHLLLAQSASPLAGIRAVARAVGIVALNLAYALRAPGMKRLAAVRAVLRGAADHVRGCYGRDPFC